MNFNPDLLEKVLACIKRQTRRLWKMGDVAEYESGAIVRVRHNGRIKWEVGRTYTAAPGRGKKGVCRFNLLSIREAIAGEINEHDAQEEGFASAAEFLERWDKINGKNNRFVKCWALRFELVPEPATMQL